MNTLILLAAAAGSPALEPVIVTATRTEVPAGESPRDASNCSAATS